MLLFLSLNGIFEPIIALLRSVGSGPFVRDTIEKLDIKAMGRSVIGANPYYALREPESPYEADLGCKNDDLRQENEFYCYVSL
jgi:hypothetical protein